jgi:hypothetical protein
VLPIVDWDAVKARMQQSRNAKYEFYNNTQNIRKAPKRVRHSKRRLEEEDRKLTRRQEKQRRYYGRLKKRKLLQELLKEEEDEEAETSSTESDEDMENCEDVASECKSTDTKKKSNSQEQLPKKALLEIKQIDIEKLSLSMEAEEEVLFVFKELGLPLPECNNNERDTKQYFDRMIKVLTYHKENYYKDLKTSIPHNNIKKIQRNLDKNFCQQLFQFEETMFNIHPKHCTICHQRKLNMVVKEGICSRCKGEHFINKFTHNNKALPVWIDSETEQVHYEAPKELKDLSIAEKLLIQKVSPLVPVIHIKNGVMACRGHCVSFFQDISTICKIFPRLPAEVTMVKVIRTSTTKGGDIVDRAFTVNKMKVISALTWLKKHNHLYNDIEIKKERLGWMKGKPECSLEDVITIESQDIEDGDNDR